MRKFLPGFLGFAVLCGVAQAQSEPGRYSRLNTWSGFTEYSNDSSHMFMGVAGGRKLLAFGAGYERRVLSTPWFESSYAAEVRPLFIESDPTITGYQISVPGYAALSGTERFQSPIPLLNPVNTTPRTLVVTESDQTYHGTITPVPGRRWTYGSGVSPLGFKISTLPRRRMQPFASGMVGTAVSARNIPLTNSSAFNFTFEFGGGVEMWRGHGHSTRIEYRAHHLSSKDIGSSNPGIDSGIFKMTYAFGR